MKDNTKLDKRVDKTAKVQNRENKIKKMRNR
jgi:hypothetical protein